MAFKKAFTIVELLVVIAVLAVLASLLIIGLSNVSNKASSASMISELSTASKLLNIEIASRNTLPTSLSSLNNGRGLNTSNITYSYIYNNSTNPPLYCVSASSGDISYKVTQSSTPTVGNCQPDGIITSGLILSYDFGNNVSYPGYGNKVTDLSGNYNASILGSPNFTSSNGGGLVFTQGSAQGILPAVSLWGSAGSREISFETVMYLDSTYSSYNHFGAGIAGFYYAMDTYGQLITMVATKDSGGSGVNNWPYVNATTQSRGKISNVVFVMKEDSYVKWYVNGSLLSTTNPPYFSFFRFKENRFSIGRGYYDDGTTQMSGTLYQARLYNRELSASEISQNFNAIRGRYGL